MPLPPGTRLGPYEVTAIIGAGGMGEVYRARDTRLGRDVALKLLSGQVADESVKKRFVREAKAISALNDPNICALYDIGTEEGRDFLVMEYLEGETLAERLNRGRLSVDEALRHAMSIASALDRAHRKGIVHRDLKPGNVMLTASGAKLLDFGLARITGGESASVAPLTADDMMMGTFEYMSPEQLSSEVVDARSDIFAFGVVLYEMLTGERPFGGKNRASTIGAILFSEPAPVVERDPSLPPHLSRVIDACLSKKPDDRIQTAHDLRLQLQWITEGAVGSAVPARRRRFQLRPAMFAWLLAALIVGGAGAMVARRLNLPAEREVRFVIAPIAGETLDWPIVSPDGRKIAFVSQTREGKRALWIRDLSSTAPVRLAGTDAAAQPFWSPDSQSIAFFAADKLQLASLATGRAESLVTSASPRGGTWSTSGTILYAPHVSSSIWATTSLGTQARQITRLDAGQKDVSHRWPELLPDSDHFLFVIRSANLQRSGLYLSSLSRPENLRKIATLQSHVVVSRDGWMFFVQNRQLWRQKFNLDDLVLSGEPQAVANEVEPDLKVTGATRISVARDGTVLFFSPPDMRTRLTWISADGAARPLTGLEHIVNPALSPDEKTVAISRIDEVSGRNSIWLVDTTSGAMTPFVTGDFNADGPIWSPDGSRILYTSDRRGSFEVYERPVGTVGGDRLLLSTGNYAQPLTATEHGTLFHSSSGQGGSAQLWFWPGGAEKPYAIPGNFEGAGDLSPDARWVLMKEVRNENAEFNMNLFALDNPQRRIQITSEGGAQPTWRRDGKAFYYAALDGEVMEVKFDAGRVSPPRPVFRISGANIFYSSRDFSPSRDGKRFVATQAGSGQRSGTATIILRR